jgi:hypothetical protein
MKLQHDKDGSFFETATDVQHVGHLSDFNATVFPHLFRLRRFFPSFFFCSVTMWTWPNRVVSVAINARLLKFAFHSHTHCSVKQA